MTGDGLGAIIPINQTSKLAGQLVSIQAGRAVVLKELMHRQDVTNARLKTLRQLLRRSKTAEGGPVKTRLLTKSVTSANKESPLYHRGVELD